MPGVPPRNDFLVDFWLISLVFLASQCPTLSWTSTRFSGFDGGVGPCFLDRGPAMSDSELGIPILVTCELLLTTCDLRPGSCYLPLVTCYLPLVTCYLPLATCYLLRATCRLFFLSLPGWMPQTHAVGPCF